MRVYVSYAYINIGKVCKKYTMEEWKHFCLLWKFVNLNCFLCIYYLTPQKRLRCYVFFVIVLFAWSVGLFQSNSRRWVMISSYNQAIMHSHAFQNSFRARICKSFKEPRNPFPAYRASASTLFVVPARQATKAAGVDSSESIPGLHKCLQIRAQ
jgi:hypothetical protein